MKRSEFRFFDHLRVRWAEVDMQKIVFNGHYLMYFDTAVAGYWRALAMPYHQTMEALQGDLYARKATVEYEDSARYDDVIEVGVRCARMGTSPVQFLGGVFRADELLVEGELIYVFADPHTQTSRPVPPALRELLQGYEAGQGMVEVRVGDWAMLGRDASALRTAVFVEIIDLAIEGDRDRAVGMHQHMDVLGKAGQRLVGGVVDHLLDDVQGVVGAGVHARPLLDGLESLEDADGGFGVGRLAGGGHGAAILGGRLALLSSRRAARRPRPPASRGCRP